MPTTPTKSRRGFASMPLEKRRAIAARGGAAVPADKRAFSQNAELAARAGRLGGSRKPGQGRKARAAV